MKTVDANMKRWLSFNFIFSCVILVFAATGLRPMLKSLSRHYKKDTIAINRHLKLLNPASLTSIAGSWDFEQRDQSVEDIGTSEYVYVKLKNFKNNALVVGGEFFVSYYSDPNNKVGHTPDVCYRQVGAVVEKISVVDIPVPGTSEKIKANLIIFHWPQYRFSEVAIYNFRVEGTFKHSRHSVRMMLGKPGNRFTYFGQIKVGVYFPYKGDSVEAERQCKKIFAELACLVAEEYFPAKDQVKRN